ncbi:hypothetical protein C922_04663 [Plasmodium inui San Antonio 1]|uniref:Peptidase A1 domain-containing protein n=1 Tax=Plasmodium inui San Antonio 1 TaxID=1237626 RepID=W7AI18_9APIC|nr:hypothetical protein C922_04663 [Plasmodium inui San Antonio 1]EUD64931.1 hypothetical protein C922_04663 [Plasmodium inui San Antonio 1]
MDFNHVKYRGWFVLPLLLPFLLWGLLPLYGGPEHNDAVLGGKKGQGESIITLESFLSSGMNLGVTREGDARGKGDSPAKEDDQIYHSVNQGVRRSNGERFPRKVYFSCRNSRSGWEEFDSEVELMSSWYVHPGEVRQSMKNSENVKCAHLKGDAHREGVLWPDSEVLYLGGIPKGAAISYGKDEEESIKWCWRLKKEMEESASMPFDPSNSFFDMFPKRYTTMRRMLASDKEDHLEGERIWVPKADDTFEGRVLNVHFTANKNLYTNVKVGGQALKLALNSRVEGIYVFMKDSQACHIDEEDEEKNRICYDPNTSRNSTWCNNDLLCLPAILSKPYECYSDSSLMLENKADYPSMYYDSLKFTESHVEGSDDVEIVDLMKAGRATGTAAETAEGEAKEARQAKGANGDKGVNADDTIFQNSDVKLVTDLTLYKGWSLFKDTDGMMGLAGRELSCRNVSAWNNIVEKNNSLYALDVNLPEGSVKPFVELASQKDSKKGDSSYGRFVPKKAGRKKSDATAEPDGTASEIHIGDYKKNFGPIVWSEPRERGGIFSDSFMQFTLYNLEVCGNNIFGKYSSNWQGVIDLSSKCLVLPKMFWLSLMEYLPVNKNDERCIPKRKEVNFDESTVPRMCSVEERKRPLPVLKFYLSDNDIVSDNNIGGRSGMNEAPFGDSPPQTTAIQEVHIPLDNLIISEEGPNDGYLCVLPDVHEGVSSENSGRTTKPLIKFGTYVINNLYVVVDQENYRVGFANKRDYHYTNERCTQRAKCIGDQFYEPALNICVDPDCSVWYFYTLNEETKKCQSISSGFYIFLLILLLLLLLDIQSYYFYRKSVHVAKVSSR